MKVLGVIPSRWGSTRFPGKPLQPLLGKPLLQWVIEGAQTAKRFTQILVATDDERIEKLARSCGVEVVLTPSDLPTGSDRVWNAVGGRGADVIANIQGDEPLLTGSLLDQLVEPLLVDPSLEMATLGRPLADGDLESPNTAKIVMDSQQNALYFSRFPIPYSREKWSAAQSVSLKHIGLYAYRGAFLGRFCSQSPTELEKAEGLEQLRALYLGAKIRVVRVDHESWGVDTPEDVLKVEKKLREFGGRV